ncbi:MAG TPA: DUF2066 domain-containing protein [Gammaproteobacteria bacterium]
MSARLFLVLAFSAMVLAGPFANADPVINLYAADVRVHDQSAATRASALKDALAQVLVKVAGSQAVLETSEAAALLENPASLLQRYRYEAVKPVPEDPEAARLLLLAEFDGGAIEQRLRAAGLPLWGRERPLTLAWVAFSNDGERRLIGRDPTDPIVDALQRAASRRGLPLVLPKMDAEDATSVSFMDVWGIYEDPLLAAAARYSPDAVFVGSIFEAGDQLWAGRWTLLRDGERQQRFELSGASPDEVAVAAIDALAEQYGQEFAVLTAMTTGSRVAVEIEGVDRLQDYAKVQSYLSGLSAVKQVGLKQVDDNRARYELDLNSSVRALEQSIALGRVLEAVPMESVPVQEEIVVTLGEVNNETGVTSSATESTSPDLTGMESPVMTPRLPVLHYRLRQ